MLIHGSLRAEALTVGINPPHNLASLSVTGNAGIFVGRGMKVFRAGQEGAKMGERVGVGPPTA